jgi:DNA-binding CsgD family transcriptional regulator
MCLTQNADRDRNRRKLTQTARRTAVMDLDRVKVTPRDQQVLDLLVLSCSNKAAAIRLQQQGNRWSIEYQSTHREAALAHPFSARRNSGWAQARQAGQCRFRESGVEVMIPRQWLTPKEIQVATLVWEGLTNREIGNLMGMTEQVVKNHLRNPFDKLGVWSRLELALWLPAMAARAGGKSRNEPFPHCPAELGRVEEIGNSELDLFSCGQPQHLCCKRFALRRSGMLTQSGRKSLRIKRLGSHCYWASRLHSETR